MKSGDYTYIWQADDWPKWRFDLAALARPMAEVSRAQGLLMGRLADVGMALRDQASLAALTEDVVKTAYWTGGSIPWVKTTEVDYCEITETEEHITPVGLENSAAKLLPKGTLLMAMYGQGITRGKVAILGIEAACNQACAAMLPLDEAVGTRFLYHFLTWRYEEIRSLAHAGQQQNLNLEIVRSLPVAVPPTHAEQDDIVAILDAIEPKIDLHRKKRAVLEELLKALLHKLMTGERRVDELDLSALGAASQGDRACR